MTQTSPSPRETSPAENSAKRPFFLHTKTGVYIALALALVLGVCYALAMARDFDFRIGHFALDSIPFYIAAVIAGLGVLFTAAAYFSAGMKIYDPIPEPSPRSAFASVLAAAMCLLVLYDAVRTAAAAVPTTAKTPSPENLGLWSAIAGLFLAASVLLGFFGENRGLKTLPVVCAVIGALSVNLAMFACYFDFTIPLNSPVRNFTTLMQAAILLFLFSEARLMIVKEPKELPPPFQLATEYAAVILGMGVSLGGILWRVIRMILAAGGSDFFLAGPEPNLPLPRLVLYFALSLIALDRLLAGSRTLRDLTKEEIEEAERKAKEAKEKKKRKRGAQETKPV